MNKLFLVLILCLVFTQQNLSAQTAPIEIVDLIGGSVNDCIFSFRVKGGLPSTSAAEKYKVSAYLSSDNTVRALVHTPNEALSNSVNVQLSAPQSGIYNVIVEDAAGTTSIFTVDMTTCDGTNNVILSAPTQGVIGQGDTYCFPITVKNFKKIAAFAFSIHWNKEYFQFSGIQNVNPGLIDFGLSTNIVNINPGQLGVNYLDPALSNLNLDDDAVLLDICLSASGPLNVCSEVSIGASPTLLDFSSAEGLTYAATNKNGSVCIGIVDVKDVLKAENTFSCFPNPANSNFTLKVAEDKYLQNAQYQVIDLLGKIVKSGVVRDLQTNVSIQDLSVGMYEIRLLTPAGFATQKLIVE
jgi:Secretion system C-terminal sorting domain